LVGGLQERNGTVLHRNGLAAAEDGAALVSGGSIAAGTGAMMGNAPPFDAAEESELWLWEEAGVLTRWASLESLDNFV
jgi:hypothetical protein